MQSLLFFLVKKDKHSESFHRVHLLQRKKIEAVMLGHNGDHQQTPNVEQNGKPQC